MVNRFSNVFGTDPSMLHRSDSPSTSVEAAQLIDTGRREREVLSVIAQFDQGCISDEVRASFPANTPYSSMTARYIALQRRGLIRCGPETRTGRSNRQQRVMKITGLGRSALKLK